MFHTCFRAYLDSREYCGMYVCFTTCWRSRWYVPAAYSFQYTACVFLCNLATNCIPPPPPPTSEAGYLGAISGSGSSLHPTQLAAGVHQVCPQTQGMYIHTYIHTYTYIHVHTYTYIHTYYIRTTYIHTYVHAVII